MGPRTVDFIGGPFDGAQRELIFVGARAIKWYVYPVVTLTGKMLYWYHLEADGCFHYVKCKPACLGVPQQGIDY